jgi:hypothetical protein
MCREQMASVPVHTWTPAESKAALARALELSSPPRVSIEEAERRVRWLLADSDLDEASFAASEAAAAVYNAQRDDVPTNACCRKRKRGIPSASRSLFTRTHTPRTLIHAHVRARPCLRADARPLVPLSVRDDPDVRVASPLQHRPSPVQHGEH